MRTTITLEAAAFEAAQAYAQARDIRLGQAVSELIRLASSGPAPIRQEGGVWVFDLPPDTPPVSADQVRKLLENFP